FATLNAVFDALMKFEMPRLNDFELRLREMSERNDRGQLLRPARRVSDPGSGKRFVSRRDAEAEREPLSVTLRLCVKRF
ncbi:MAG: hypothetical protein ACJ8J0_02610, partial [Longimicrobiaceae bacterium]